MRLLITGSSGYIGSVLCKEAKERGHYVVGVDKNYTPHKYYNEFHQVNINSNNLAQLDKIDAVFHLAASADVTNSTIRPSLYYHNNIGATAKFLDTLLLNGYNNPIIFSSTAAVYERSNSACIEEEGVNPFNSYGTSKLMCEVYLKDLYSIHNLPIAIFRYFNVAGAYGDVGDHLDSHHVLQKLCYSAKENKPFRIFGHDLDTRDGTCVRDYIHVRDVCNAHFKALDYIRSNPGNHYHIFNLGTNSGVTVRELAARFKVRTGKNIQIESTGPRPGDPYYLVANPSKFINTTDFKYEYSDIDLIIDSAWDWYRSNYAV